MNSREWQGEQTKDTGESQFSTPGNHQPPFLCSLHNLRSLNGSPACAQGWKPILLFQGFLCKWVLFLLFVIVAPGKTGIIGWEGSYSQWNGVLAAQNSPFPLSLICWKHLKYFLRWRKGPRELGGGLAVGASSDTYSGPGSTEWHSSH